MENVKNVFKKLLRQKRGIVGLEAAIVLIAFVIIAAAFSFMVVNQGLFATERGKAVVQEGLQQASTPLSIDGTMFLRSTSAHQIHVVVVPLRAYGVDFVAIWRNETVVTLKIGSNAWGNIYGGIVYDSSSPSTTYDPTDEKFDTFVGLQLLPDKCLDGAYGTCNSTEPVAGLAIENSDGDEALNSDEKGYLIINLGSGTSYEAAVRDKIVVEIRLEKTAPLSIELNVPEHIEQNAWITETGA
jgi:flagellin FlaB